MKKLNSWAFKKVLSSTLGAFLGLGLIWGCAPVERIAEPWKQPHALALAAGLHQRGQGLTSMVARGGFDYTRDNERFYFNCEFIAAKPGRLLFTAFDPAGRPAFRLASDGRTLTGLLYSSREYVVGPATPEVFSQFFPFDLEPEQLIALLTGAAAELQSDSIQGFESGSAGDVTSELVIQPAAAAPWRLRIKGPLDQDPRRAVLLSAARGAPRRPDISVRFSAVKEIPREDQGGFLEPFPHRIAAEWSGQGSQGSQGLSIRYDEVRLGQPLTEDLFRLKKPESFTEVRL